ncbi:hypothetical protein [Mesorhizobium sp.]|uniref:hypothetical protein n=1 Tax=Mesorhizobium sp. TaxID=1871066 RepID=UPI00257AE57E|nr:hypothetical protein [Mesorhizobium sp.]
MAAALVLNRPDWLADMHYTLAEAIERVGPQWLALIPEAVRVVEYEDELAAGVPGLRARAFIYGSAPKNRTWLVKRRS